MTECPNCEEELQDEEDMDELQDDPENDYFCLRCGGLFSEDEIDD